MAVSNRKRCRRISPESEDKFAYDFVSKLSKRQNVTEWWEQVRTDDQELFAVLKRYWRVSQETKSSGEVSKMKCDLSQL